MQTFKTPLTEIYTCSSQGDFGHQNCVVKRGCESVCYSKRGLRLQACCCIQQTP